MKYRFFYRLQTSFHLNVFLLGLLLLSLSAWFFNSVSPEEGRAVQIAGILLLTATAIILLYSVLNNVRRVFIVSLGLCTLLFLRIFRLYDILYYLLLCVFLFTLNMALKRHKRL